VVHASYANAISRIDHPAGSGLLRIRKKTRLGDQWQRNGVVYLKQRFLQSMVENEKWQPESAYKSAGRIKPILQSYPGFATHQAEETSGFGDFDFVTRAPSSGALIAIEWETGNVSSSHRSVIKLITALNACDIQAAVLIVPSRELYKHLTDRVGNFAELAPYLGTWQQLGARGLFAITIVEHDELTDSQTHPYLPTGNDGRAKEGRSKIKG